LYNIIGSFLLFVVLFFFLDIGKIGDGLSRLDAGKIVWACCISAVVLLVASIRWWIFVRAARFPHGFWVSVRVRLVAQLFNIVVPSGLVGDGLQVFLVSRRPKLSGPLALATIVSDRIVALVAVLLMLLSTAWMLPGETAGVVYGTLMTLGLVLAMFVAALLLTQKFQSRRLSAGRFTSILRFFWETTRAVATFRNRSGHILVALFLAFLGVLGNSAIAWFLISDLADIQYWTMIPTFCLVMLSNFVPVTFSGMGVREWIFFANLKSFGLSLEESVALSLVLFGVLAVTAALMSFVFGGYSLQRRDSVNWIKAVFQKQN
jgi:glycosyltransferase 2 family protein